MELWHLLIFPMKEMQNSSFSKYLIDARFDILTQICQPFRQIFKRTHTHTRTQTHTHTLAHTHALAHTHKQSLPQTTHTCILFLMTKRNYL